MLDKTFAGIAVGSVLWLAFGPHGPAEQAYTTARLDGPAQDAAAANGSGDRRIVYRGEERQELCLAQNLYFEAANQGDRGMGAVASVVMNRLRDGRYGSTVCQIVYAKFRHTCQFSWTCDGHRHVVHDMRIWRRALRIARLAYRMRLPDVTGQAEFYHASYVHPGWADVYQRTVKIGAHIFYRGT